MNMATVKEKASALGMKPGKAKKDELIRQIQQAEGYNACFGNGTVDCPYTECCFRSDCIGGSKKSV